MFWVAIGGRASFFSLFFFTKLNQIEQYSGTGFFA